jgi:hypothetical protein
MTETKFYAFKIELTGIFGRSRKVKSEKVYRPLAVNMDIGKQ